MTEPMLQRLVDLRERELERLSADMASRQAMRLRYLGNIDRLLRLCESGVPAAPAPRPPAFVAALSVNGAQFRQSLLQMAQAQRDDLAQHEARMEAAQGPLQHALRQHEGLRQLAARRQHGERRGTAEREQQRQDELALQCWQRTRP